MISPPPTSLDAVSTVTRQRTEEPYIPLRATMLSWVVHSRETMQVVMRFIEEPLKFLPGYHNKH